MRRLALPLLTVLLATAPAMAQSHAQFGIQAGLSFAQGDLKDANYDNGFSFGIHGAFPLQGGTLIRPRLDLTRYSQSTFGIDLTLKTTFIGADFLFHFQGRPQGGYFVFGLGYQDTKEEASFGGYSASDSAGSYAVALGFGYQFNATVGAEARYQTSRPDFGTGSVSVDALNLGVTVRF